MSAYHQFTTNHDGFTVKVVAPKPTTDAAERFLRHVQTIEIDGEQHRIWTGSPRFRVSDDLVMTPRRFVLLLVGDDLMPGIRYKAMCRVPKCISLGHIGW
jgi:hypothetical protein